MEFDKSLEHKIMTLPRCWFKREKLACLPQPLHFLHNQGQQLWLQSTNMNLPWICTSSLIFNNNNLAKWVAFLWVQILLRIQIVLPMNRSQLNSKNHSIISIQFLFPGKRHASPTLHVWQNQGQQLKLHSASMKLLFQCNVKSNLDNWWHC